MAPAPVVSCDEAADLLIPCDGSPEAFVQVESPCCAALQALNAQDCLCSDNVTAYIDDATTGGLFPLLGTGLSSCPGVEQIIIGNACPLSVPDELAGNQAEVCNSLATSSITDPSQQCDSLLDGSCSSPFLCEVTDTSETPAAVFETRVANCCDTFQKMNDGLCFCRNSEIIDTAITRPSPAANVSSEVADRQFFLYESLTTRDAGFTDSLCGFNIAQERDECISVLEDAGVIDGAADDDADCTGFASSFGSDGCTSLFDGSCPDPVSCPGFASLLTECCSVLGSINAARCLCGGTGAAVRNATLVDAGVAQAIEQAFSSPVTFAEAVCGIVPSEEGC